MASEYLYNYLVPFENALYINTASKRRINMPRVRVLVNILGKVHEFERQDFLTSVLLAQSHIPPHFSTFESGTFRLPRNKLYHAFYL